MTKKFQRFLLIILLLLGCEKPKGNGKGNNQQQPNPPGSVTNPKQNPLQRDPLQKKYRKDFPGV